MCVCVHILQNPIVRIAIQPIIIAILFLYSFLVISCQLLPHSSWVVTDVRDLF